MAHTVDRTTLKRKEGKNDEKRAGGWLEGFEQQRSN